MANVPLLADLEMWMGLASPDSNTAARMGESLAAARAEVEDRCDFAGYPQAIRTAVLLTAHRIYNRTNTPEGVASFGEFGAIRITALDADVEALIKPYLKVVFS